MTKNRKEITEFKLGMDSAGHFTDFLRDLSDDFFKFPEFGTVVFGLFLLFLKFIL